MCRNMKLLNVFLFHGDASCLHFSLYTILLSGTLNIGTPNCLMSTYFTGMRLVYIFHGIRSFVLIHYMNVLLLYVYLFHDKLFTFWYITWGVPEIRGKVS